MARYDTPAAFRADCRRHFRFLVAEFGFAGVQIARHVRILRPLAWKEESDAGVLVALSRHLVRGSEGSVQPGSCILRSMANDKRPMLEHAPAGLQ